MRRLYFKRVVWLHGVCIDCGPGFTPCTVPSHFPLTSHQSQNIPKRIPFGPRTKNATVILYAYRCHLDHSGVKPMNSRLIAPTRAPVFERPNNLRRTMIGWLYQSLRDAAVLPITRIIMKWLRLKLGLHLPLTLERHLTHINASTTGSVIHDLCDGQTYISKEIYRRYWRDRNKFCVTAR